MYWGWGVRNCNSSLSLPLHHYWLLAVLKLFVMCLCKFSFLYLHVLVIIRFPLWFDFFVLFCFVFLKKSGPWYAGVKQLQSFEDLPFIHSHFITDCFSASPLNSFWSCRQYILQILPSPRSSRLQWVKRNGSSSSREVVPFCPKVRLQRARTATAAALHVA